MLCQFNWLPNPIVFTWHTNYNVSTSHIFLILSSLYPFSFHTTLAIMLINFLKDTTVNLLPLQGSFLRYGILSLETTSKQKIVFTSFFYLTSLMEFYSQVTGQLCLIGNYCQPLGSLPLYHLTFDLVSVNRAANSSLEIPCSCCPEEKLPQCPITSPKYAPTMENWALKELGYEMWIQRQGPWVKLCIF